jgi:hypothetical protein
MVRDCRSVWDASDAASLLTGSLVHTSHLSPFVSRQFPFGSACLHISCRLFSFVSRQFPFGSVCFHISSRLFPPVPGWFCVSSQYFKFVPVCSRLVLCAFPILPICSRLFPVSSRLVPRVFTLVPVCSRQFPFGSVCLPNTSRLFPSVPVWFCVPSQYFPFVSRLFSFGSVYLPIVSQIPVGFQMVQCAPSSRDDADPFTTHVSIGTADICKHGREHLLTSSLRRIREQCYALRCHTPFLAFVVSGAATMCLGCVPDTESHPAHAVSGTEWV